MALKSYLAAAAAATMVATPVVAAPTMNPASSLSLVGTPRASTHVKHSNDIFAGIGLIIAIVAGGAAVIAIVVVATNSTSP